jgi:hypothetical protein
VCCCLVPAGGARAGSTVARYDLALSTVAVDQLCLVSIENFSNLMNSTTFVLFDKYCPIVDQLGSKDSSRDFQLNCVISYFLPTFNTPCKRLKINVM